MNTWRLEIGDPAGREYSGRLFIVVMIVLMLCVLGLFVVVARGEGDEADERHLGAVAGLGGCALQCRTGTR